MKNNLYNPLGYIPQINRMPSRDNDGWGGGGYGYDRMMEDQAREEAARQAKAAEDARQRAAAEAAAQAKAASDAAAQRKADQAAAQKAANDAAAAAEQRILQQQRAEAAAQQAAFNTSINGLRGRMDSQFSGFAGVRDQQYNALNGGQNTLNSLATDNQMGINNVQDTANSVNNNVNTGFNDQAARLDTLDAANQSTQDAVAAGFDNAQIQAAGNAALMSMGFEDVNSGQNTLAENQGILQDGQTALGADLTGLSADGTTQYNNLMLGQANAAGNAQAYQSNFDDYVARYSQDTADTEDRLEDYAQQQVGGFNAVQDQVGRVVQDAAMMPQPGLMGYGSQPMAYAPQPMMMQQPMMMPQGFANPYMQTSYIPAPAPVVPA